MKTVAWILLAVVIAIAGIYFVFYAGGNESEDLDFGDDQGVDRSLSGEVLSVDLSQMAFDGPAIIVLQSSNGATARIAVPSMGLPLCEAYANIVSVNEVEVGETVSVRGEIDSEGNIVPCSDDSHYLRIES